MSQFEYVAVLISIIVGLALTQILRGVGRMVTTKDGPRPYWVHLVWTFYLFFLIAGERGGARSGRPTCVRILAWAGGSVFFGL